MRVYDPREDTKDLVLLSLPIISYLFARVIKIIFHIRTLDSWLKTTREL